MAEIYEEKDIVLHMLNLPNPCTVRISVTGEDIHLIVGPRDWSWSRKTGKLIGAGTLVGEGSR